MKTADLNKIILEGTPVVTGRLMTYKAEQTEKAGANEKYGILVGSQVLDFTIWAPKGTPVSAIKRPACADRIGSAAVAINAVIRIDGKYLRTGADSVHAIEA